MNSRDYVIRLGVFTGAMFALVQLSILVIDLYGISPLRIDLVGVNHDKPRRVDIDRQLKSYEVWLREPKTIFLVRLGSINLSNQALWKIRPLRPNIMRRFLRAA